MHVSGPARVLALQRRKLDAKAIEVTLIGFEPESKGYRLWDRQTRSVHLSRDVTFDESSFPSLQGAETHPTPSTSQVAPHVITPVTAVPHPPALPPQRAPSPAHSHSSEEEDVEDLLDPK